MKGYQRTMAESVRLVNLPVPELLYRRLQRAAELTYRSMDEILAGTLNVALSVPPEAPPEVRDELEAMARLSDAALWAASESSLSPAQQRRLRQLNHIAGARSLTAAEATEQARLLDSYQRSVLRRARAWAILSYRGYALPDRTDLGDSTNDDDDAQTAD